jgi:hypothetical protein
VLPFGFNLEIGEIQNAFNISKNGSTVGMLSTVRLNLSFALVMRRPTVSPHHFDSQKGEKKADVVCLQL